ncbi:MAG: hypothetical protein HZB11_00020 [Candidatus Yonathbacteria bacterium]|nr:hypothetical protein [Candidatus Yonathbacteria bacterium]
MEGELFNQIQKQEEVTPAGALPETKPFPHLSFIPSGLLKKKEGDEPRGTRDKCALFGMILGILAVVSWVVILFGILYSILGIILSVIGLKSTRKKWARIGLTLSVIGLIISIWYVFAARNGVINYNYFTSEFWGL